MKRLYLIVGCYIVAAFAALADQRADFQAAMSAWEELAAQPTGAVPASQSRSVLAKLDAVWQALPQTEKEAVWPRMALAYVGQAEVDLASNSSSEAARQLKSAGSLYQRFGGRIEYATKSPNTFFERLAKLQTGIASVTGSDPLAGMTDYLFRKQDGKYIVARAELDPEVKGITVDGVTETETLAQVLELSAQDGQAMIERTRWIVGPKGRVDETLRRATREVSFDEDGRLSAKPLNAAVFAPAAKSQEAEPTQPIKTPAPASALPTATPSPSSPPPAVAETPALPAESKWPLWPWLVGIAALIVIVAVALKRRA
jgi:hypothetical protein